MKTFAIADIHGNLDLLKSLVEQSIKFDATQHRLIFLGDYIDRGKDSKGVIEYIMNLEKLYPKNIIRLRGNHEDMAERFMNDTLPWENWEVNGGADTLRSFGTIESMKAILLPFIKSCKLYHETEKNIFVHAGLLYNKSPKQAEVKELLWTRMLGMYWGKKQLIVGHTIVNEVTILHNNVVMVDTGADFKGKLSAFEVTEQKIYRAERVTEIKSSIIELDEKLLEGLRKDFAGQASDEEIIELAKELTLDNKAV